MVAQHLESYSEHDRREFPDSPRFIWRSSGNLFAHSFINTLTLQLKLGSHQRWAIGDLNPAWRRLPVTLYKHTYIHLNEYSKNILDSDLKNLKTLCLIFCILVLQIWCSSVENLLSRCSSFSCKLLEMPSNRIATLVLKRMVKFFLPPNHKLIEFSTVMFKSEIYEIQVAVLAFVRALNFKKFNDKDPQFVNVRSSLASLFNTALRSKNYIIRLEALSIFCVMAQFTDIRITQETIARFPDLYPEVKAYMSQIPQSGFLTNKDKFEIMEKQLCNTENEPELSVTLSEQSKSVLSLLLPS
ncbi:uncharacterized protein CEXT_408481 [Caerostris extrusa]|uniref:Uncharacterized protein n=1 Tax=Caerostris extrusa TaxID=172846 RepID=A0AAV4PHH2_CAEEX|nr:uncharacterized protein CEXT_408481 [Caerostris extrusa]